VVVELAVVELAVGVAWSKEKVDRVVLHKLEVAWPLEMLLVAVL